uniref:Uncharacterized protein n=1 Tax=Arundo donax TaxID=35708 RepID=A0A0A9EC00_ARUDO
MVSLILPRILGVHNCQLGGYVECHVAICIPCFFWQNLILTFCRYFYVSINILLPSLTIECKPNGAARTFCDNSN